jgi:hypothetical protein
MKFDSCPACKSNTIDVVRRLDSNSTKQFFEFSKLKFEGLIDGFLETNKIFIVACGACGHHWYGNQPTKVQLLMMYNGAKKVSSHVSENLGNARREMELLYATLKRPHPKMLDYGAGACKWSFAASQIGFDVYAYEPSLNRTKEDKKSFYLTNDIEDLNGLKFDAVNIEQVLEHIPDPRQTLDSIRNLCKQDTILRITVPNILRAREGINLLNEWPWNGSEIHTMAPYEHLHGFTPKSLEKLLNISGFKVLQGVQINLNYPSLLARRFLGKIIPKLGSTKVIAGIK